MRKYRYLAAAAATAALLLSAATPASAVATTVLTYGGPGGSSVAVGDVLTANLAAGTTANLYSTSSGSTGIRCATSSFTATVDSNPAAPGIATERLTGQAFGTCTSNVLGVTGVRSIRVDNLPYAASIDSGTRAVTLTGTANGPIQTTMVLNTLLGTITCVYQANGNTLSGATADADNSISFANQQFNKVSGPGTCFSNGYFTAKYAPVTGPGGPVYVN